MTKKTEKTKKKVFKLISDERLLELYAAMIHFRLADERLGTGADQEKGRSSAEAVAAGVLLHLHKEDRVLLAAHRRAHRLLSGEKLEHLLTPSHRRAGGRLIPIDGESTGAAQVMLAAGVALALKGSRKNLPVVILFVEGKLTSGSEWEAALRFVFAQKLGIIIVCHGAAVRKRGKVRQSSKFIFDEPGSRVAFKGLPPALQVDAKDCVAVYRVAQEALTHAREGSRPTVIRALDAEEFIEADGKASGDPIARMEDYLRSKKLFSEKMRKRVVAEVKKKLKPASGS